MKSSSIPPDGDGASTSTELEALREFAAVLERIRPRLDAAIEAAALGVPAFAALMQTLDPETREREGQRSRAAETAALHEGRWEPLLESLRGQGAFYAQIGIGFEDWWALLRPYREVVYDELLPAELRRERAAIDGMGLFIDRAMAAIGLAYVDARQAMVRKAEEEREHYQRLFSESPLGKMVLHWEEPPDRASFQVVSANASATVMSGGKLARFAGTRLDPAAAGLDPDLNQWCATAAETNEPQHWTWHIGHGAETRTYEARGYAMGGGHVGVVFQDVTARRRMQEALASHAADLERSNRELDEFAYVASHDLKAPLRDIDTLAGWIEEDAAEQLPEGSRRHLRTLRERIGRMERLLEDLLQYSRAGRIRHEPELLDLGAVIDSAAHLAAIPPSFTLVVSGEAPALRAPRVPLELVLRNLLANAAKHHDRDAGRIEVALKEIEGAVEIAISDDGPGIPAEFHGRIFAMFQTLKPRDEVEGSGMGLAVVKKIVETHGGHVAVESAGRGTTFRITWPTEPTRRIER